MKVYFSRIKDVYKEMLKGMLKIDYFDPSEKKETIKIKDNESQKMAECDYCLWVIAQENDNTYSTVEAMHYSGKYPKETLVCLLSSDSNCSADEYRKYIDWELKIKYLFKKNGTKCFSAIEEAAEWLNAKNESKAVV